jgi:hypothetical protein
MANFAAPLAAPLHTARRYIPRGRCPSLRPAVASSSTGPVFEGWVVASDRRDDDVIGDRAAGEER